METKIDLAFRCTGSEPVPADHGYALFGAVSRVLPEFHGENGYGLHPIRGRQLGDRRMMLTPASQLTIRVPMNRISEVLPLVGQSLRIGEAKVRVGVPEVRPLIPASALWSRLVVIKIAHIKPASTITTEQFHGAVRRQLDKFDVSSDVIITLGKRRTMHLKRNEIVGYEVLLEGLTAEESQAVQEQGLGGRRHLGCGVFVGVKTEGDANG